MVTATNVSSSHNIPFASESLHYASSGPECILWLLFVQFSGAMLLGRGVTSTIKSGIVDPKAFVDTPEILMYGMFCALTASGVWLLVATMMELPVSTTHSIFGCALNYFFSY
jgi:phosphate/sulfate permease